MVTFILAIVAYKLGYDSSWYMYILPILLDLVIIERVER